MYLIFITTFIWNNSILRIILRDTVINVKTSSRKVPVFFVGFYWNLNCLDTGSKKIQISSLIRIRSVRAKLFHADRQTDNTKLIMAFRNFANAPRNSTLSSHKYSYVFHIVYIIYIIYIPHESNGSANQDSVYCAVRAESFSKTDYVKYLKDESIQQVFSYIL